MLSFHRPVATPLGGHWALADAIDSERAALEKDQRDFETEQKVFEALRGSVSALRVAQGQRERELLREKQVAVCSGQLQQLEQSHEFLDQCLEALSGPEPLPQSLKAAVEEEVRSLRQEVADKLQLRLARFEAEKADLQSQLSAADEVAQGLRLQLATSAAEKACWERELETAKAQAARKVADLQEELDEAVARGPRADGKMALLVAGTEGTGIERLQTDFGISKLEPVRSVARLRIPQRTPDCLRRPSSAEAQRKRNRLRSGQPSQQQSSDDSTSSTELWSSRSPRIVPFSRSRVDRFAGHGSLYGSAAASAKTPSTLRRTRSEMLHRVARQGGLDTSDSAADLS